MKKKKSIWGGLGMKRQFLFLLFSGGILPSSVAHSAECTVLRTYKEVVGCILVNHPDVLRADAERIRSGHLESKAAQRPNLEFTGKALRNLDDSSQSNGEVDVTYTFELGGKRAARIEKAKLEGEMGRVDLEATKAESLLKVLTSLQHLRYLKIESDLVEEGIGTFEKILKSYRARLKLTPEQDVSASVFSLALEDYKIRRSQLATESAAILRVLELQTGGKIEVSESLFPPKRTSWPAMSGQSQNHDYRPTSIRLAETVFHSAQSEINIAKAEAWPDLKLGPDYEWTQGANGSEKSLGLTLTLPLPFWNRNQGGIAVAEAETSKARIALSVAEKELAVEKASWLVKYENGVKAIREGISSDDMRKRHQKLRSQFTSGLVPSPLVIEANRQILEFTKSKNEQELSTLEALWNLQRLEGRLEEELP